MRNEFDEINLVNVKALTRLEITKIGKNINELRLKHCLTLNDVAFFTFSNTSSMWRLEKGLLCNITLSTLMKLCALFNVSLTELLKE